MTLGQFSTVVGATPKWVQNARAVLKLRGRYDTDGAKRLGLAQLLAEATGMPLKRAHAAAAEALAAWPASREWVREHPDGSVRVVVNLEYYLSGFASRLSLSRSYYAERQRGRRPKRVRDAIAAARAYGVDISLLEESLKRTPEERLKRMDEALEFFKSARVIG